jgi:RHS repeat-associated protein
MSNDPKEVGSRPGMTSGPSLPIQGPAPAQPFSPGTFPGRDMPGSAPKTDADKNPFAQLYRSPYGGGQQSPEGQTDPLASFAPAITLPTGGGALRSTGEKFSPNPFTGAGSMSVPVATSPGRGGFGPSLSLSYGSGLGNGPFGLGWQLGVPAISRKTDKGLPEYRDAHPDLLMRDTFILAGVEDLVPLLDGQGDVWEQVRDGYVIHRFHPRVEGGFSRVERWTKQDDGDVHWRTISPANVTSLFGKTTSARVSDPANPKRVFSWLIEESYDDRGNIIVYEYKQENLEGVNDNAPEERPRLATTAVQAQRYLKRIKYGNSTPFSTGGWLFEVVLDYGEHGTIQSTQSGDQLDIDTGEDRPWGVRQDTYSTNRAGFEIRTRRLCRRVLMFHHFSTELGISDYLVASTDFVHDEDPVLTRLTGVVQRSYRLDSGTGYFEIASLPAVEFDYSDPIPDPLLHEITDPGTLRNLPSGIDGRMHRFVDLDGEGLPGVVTEHAGTWYYKRGLGDGRFGPMMALPSRPSTLGAPGTQLMDIDGDGGKELVSFVAPTPGFFRRVANEPHGGGWGDFRSFSSIPNIDWQDPRLTLIDLSGDGFPDVLFDRGRDFVWYRSKGAEGFDTPRVVPHTGDDRSRPVVWFSDRSTAIQFADMTGDGLVDIVRIRNGEVVYWPSLGYGRFGTMVRMRGLTPFDAADLFDPGRVRMADVDGNGATDIIYLDARGAILYRNECGNSFAAAQRIVGFPGVRSVDWAEVVDLKGNGTGCLVWSSSLSSGRGGVLRYIDLMGGQKPHLLIASRNNMGAETKVAYASSTKFYLADKAAGKPWATKLPFPMQVIERVESIDYVSRQRYVQHYAYHHGFYDGQEREFRGFGMVETWDTESFEDFVVGGLFSFEQFETVEENLHQPPMYTKSWFHTGAFIDRRRISTQFADEYWHGDGFAFELPDGTLPSGLSGTDAREALRALSGRTLRSEVYALDGSADEDKPYTVSEATFAVRQVQARGKNRHAVWLVLDREALSYHYERNAADPRIAHAFTLEVDDYGTVLRSASVVYPRRVPDYPEQGDYVNGVSAVSITLAENEVEHIDATNDVHRLAVPTQSRSYQLHGLTIASATAFAFADILTAADNATQIAYLTPPTGAGTIEKRLLSHAKIRYMANDLSGPLGFGTVESRALPYDSDTMAMTDAQRTAAFGSLTGAPTNTELQDEGKYVLADSAWWVRTGHPTYDANKFYAVTSVVDPFSNTYSTTYDSHSLLVVSASNPLTQAVTASNDYRVLGPWQITDPNGNRTQVAFDVLGFVVKSAVLGKVGDSDGDTLSDPTTTFEYDLFSWHDDGTPNWAKSRVRETHQDINTRWLEQRSYFSGAGSVIMVKVQARPGLAPERDENGELVYIDDELQYEDTSPDVRWVGNGRVVKDNKGNLLKAYEPYYSSTPNYEDEAELVEQGVTALNHYDPLGRLTRTDFPNGTFSKVVFTPWQQTTHDQNDTVTESDWYAARTPYGGSDPSLEAEERAADLAAVHHGTPSVVHLDVLGRPFLAVAHNKNLEDESEFYETRSVLDIQGNVLEVIDARENTAEERTFGMLGQSLKIISVDAGNRWHLLNALGQPMRSWDSRNQRFTHTYDLLRRPVDHSVSVGGGSEKLLGRIVYGELLSTPDDTNHNGKVYRVYDGAGVATSLEYDFKGNALEEQRELVASKTTQPDWTALVGEDTIAEMATAVAAALLLDSETFSASSQRDALNRVLVSISPDDSEVLYTYDEGGALQKVEVKHRGSSTAETVVGDITYNARGQRESVTYGSTSSPTTVTEYTYDPQTFRLSQLTTTRDSDDATLQSLHYHYDPVGNITDIRDSAQQTVYYNNSVVEAANSYTYDATYRLIEATGREHSSEGTTQRTHVQLAIGPQPMTNDPAAMRRFRQKYTYDAVGNILKMQHIPASGTGWTRYYEYAGNGNRLVATSAPGDDPEGPYTHTYDYDAHGSMTVMPHLSSMVWNHGDELQEVEVGTETVYFQYAGGIRSRKYVEKSGATTEERIYLGPWEIYRKRISGDLDLERESLHISDGSGRICIIETKTFDEEVISTPPPVWRYQLSNHLGSAATEVTQEGDIITYEEYHPYGTSAYRAVSSSVDVSAKRYRYTGMERDEETSLEYHCARYYAPWLGRWSTTDRLGLADNINRYQYTDNCPSSSSDINGNEGEDDPPLSTPVTPYTIEHNEASGAHAPVQIAGGKGTVFHSVNEPVDKAHTTLWIDEGDNADRIRADLRKGTLTEGTINYLAGEYRVRSTFNLWIDIEHQTVTVEVLLHSQGGEYDTPEARQAIEEGAEAAWTNQVTLNTPDSQDADSVPDGQFAVWLDVKWVDDPTSAHRNVTIMPSMINSLDGKTAKVPFRDNMGLEGGAIDNSGKAAGHEIGHALGLPDEYGMSVEWGKKTGDAPHIIDHRAEVEAGRQQAGIMHDSTLRPLTPNFLPIKRAFANALFLDAEDIEIQSIPQHDDARIIHVP